MNTQSDNMCYVAMLSPTHVVGSLEQCGFLNIKRSFAGAGTAAQLLLPGVALTTGTLRSSIKFAVFTTAVLGFAI